MSLDEIWEKSVYKIFLDILNSKKQKISKIFDWKQIQEENPFSTRLINNSNFWKACKIERSFVTTLGQSTYENIALSISKTQYKKAFKGFTYKSKIDSAINSKINTIIKELNEGKRSPDWNKEVEEILSLSNSIDTNLINLRITMDLYIPSFKDQKPFYAELKSPKPNKDQCMQTKQKLLKVYFSEDWEGENLFLAFPYNPYKTRAKYDHPHIKAIFKIPDCPRILMGEEFWNYIGNDQTYPELLKLAKRAGENINILS